ncbi:Subtilisin-like serine peptidase (Serine peptidase, clan sb, family s8-like protein) [Balamuthia mandrillaris]
MTATMWIDSEQEGKGSNEERPKEVRKEEVSSESCLVPFLLLMISLVAAQTPLNDRCEDREELASIDQIFLSSSILAGATSEEGTPSPCMTADLSGVWYGFMGDGRVLEVLACSQNKTANEGQIFAAVHVDASSCHNESMTCLGSAFLGENCDEYLRVPTTNGTEYLLFLAATNPAEEFVITLQGRYCDGKLDSGAVLDVCGICGGNGTSCLSGCDNKPFSILEVDACGVCGGNNQVNTDCFGCDGVPNSGLVLDECGVCGGDNSRCMVVDCEGTIGGNVAPDICGVCGGNGTSCLDCAGCPWGDAVEDDCGVCGGENSCYGCDGVKYSGIDFDACGECGGNGSTCVGCDDIPYATLDACGVCNGDNSTCECVFYKDFGTPEMDCTLFSFTVANALSQINSLLSILEATDAAIDAGYPGDFNEVVVEEIMASNEFIDDCVNDYCREVSTFIDNMVEATEAFTRAVLV